MSPFGKQLLKRSPLWASDGTFKTAPPPFKQIYMVAAMSPSGRILPAAYALLQDKTSESYSRLWDTVQFELSSGDRHEHQGPKTLKVDFEQAAINTFKAVFPQSHVIFYCSFFKKEKNEVRMHARSFVYFVFF